MSRGFFITRAAFSNEDPTALEFYPPKGSDELHEALKQAFPDETNLAGRMRKAVIEFLLHEQQAEQMTSASPEYFPSPQSSFVSTLPSPAMPSMHMQSEVSQSVQAGQPSQQELMDVWSLPSKPQAKMHTRRTMTAEEKKAYKQKRLIGACSDCKKRRRKCEHNIANVGASPPRKAGKHKKRVVAQTPASNNSTSPIPNFPSVWPTFPSMADMDMASMTMDAGMDTEMPSFDFETSGFNLDVPDLYTDWDLFPDLHNTHSLDMSPVSTWSSNQIMFDNSMSSSTHHAAPANAGGLDSSFSYAPKTPVSLSPMSRTQSSHGGEHVSNVQPLLATPAQSRDSGNQPMFAPFAMDFMNASPTTSAYSTPNSSQQSSSDDSHSPTAGSGGLVALHLQAPGSARHNHRNVETFAREEQWQSVRDHLQDHHANTDPHIPDIPEIPPPSDDHTPNRRREECRERGHVNAGRRPECDLCFKALYSSESSSGSGGASVITQHSSTSSSRGSSPLVDQYKPSGLQLSSSLRQIQFQDGSSHDTERATDPARTISLGQVDSLGKLRQHLAPAPSTNKHVYVQPLQTHVRESKSHGQSYGEIPRVEAAGKAALIPWQSSSPSGWSMAQGSMAIAMIAMHCTIAQPSGPPGFAACLLLASVATMLLVNLLCFGIYSHAATAAGGQERSDGNVKIKIQISSLALGFVAWAIGKTSRTASPPSTVFLLASMSPPIRELASSTTTRRSLRSFIQGLQCSIDTRLGSVTKRHGTW